jgi:hypothetical protein
MAIFCLALIAGIGAAPAQDIFLKYKKDNTGVETEPTEKPLIYLAPQGTAKKTQPQEYQAQLPKEIFLKNKALQQSTNEKIRAFKEWNEKGRKPKTAQEYVEYAALARSITHAQNLERREVLMAELAARQKIQNEKPAPDVSAPQTFEMVPPSPNKNPPLYNVPKKTLTSDL